MTQRWRAPFLLLLLSGVGLAVWLAHRAPSPPPGRIAIQAEGPCARGVALLLSDLVEQQNRWVVIPQGAVSPAQTPCVHLHLSRTGTSLKVEASLDSHPFIHVEGPPAAALAGLAKALSLDPPGSSLLPSDVADEWELLDLGGRSQDEATSSRVEAARALVARQPNCATARLAFANLLTRFLVENLDADTMEAQQGCEQNFQAGLAIQPSYPRLAALYAIHLSDVGRQREALQLLQTTLRLHPGNAGLLNALAYAARTSGLLDLANRALIRQAELLGLPRGQIALADNTLLYTGDYQNFAAGLDQLPSGPLRAFYQGYSRLLKGDREGAKRYFSEAKPGGLGSSLFIRLSEIYRLALEGRQKEANAALDQLGSERMWMHLPDGEFTFKLAEAYGFLGRPGEALDVAERASVQGFGCTPWFERSPFLAEARRLPRWISLDTHLQARRMLLEEANPPSAFHL